MNRLEQYRLDAFPREVQYNKDHPLATPIARATALFTELDGVVTAMRAHNGSQAVGLTAFRGGTDDRRQAFLTLLGEMRVLNKLARGLDPVEFPAMREQFRMPESRSFVNIAGYGRAFATNASDQEAVFTERGLPAGFIAGFTAMVTAAEAAVQNRNTGLINRSGATAGIAAMGRRGLAISRELDSIMSVALRHDPVLLAAWQTAKRVARRAPATPPTAPTAPVESGS